MRWGDLRPGAIGAAVLCIVIGGAPALAQNGWVQTQPGGAFGAQGFQPGSGLNLKYGDSVALMSQPHTFLYRMRTADIRGDTIYFLERNIQHIATFTEQTQFYGEGCNRIGHPEFLKLAQMKPDLIVVVTYPSTDPYRGKITAIRPGTTAPLVGFEARFC